MKIKTLLLSLLVFSGSTYAFTITGNTELKNTNVTLNVFDGFKASKLASTTTDNLGKFNLEYTNYQGGAELDFDGKKLFVILANQDISFKSSDINLPINIIFNDSVNKLFINYANNRNNNNHLIPAWNFLLKKYQDSNILNKNTIAFIENHIKEIQNYDLSAIKNYPYLDWFIQLRNKMHLMRATIQKEKEQKEKLITKFRDIDITNSNLWRSGFIDGVISLQFLLLENTYYEVNKLEAKLNAEIDYILQKFAGDKVRLNKVTEYMFDLLEKRSLIYASKYLANKIFTQVSGVAKAKLAMYNDLDYNNDAPKIINTTFATNTLVIFIKDKCKVCNQELSALFNDKNIINNQVIVVFETAGANNKYLLPENWLTVVNKTSFKDYFIHQDITYFILEKGKFAPIKQPLNLQYSITNFYKKLQVKQLNSKAEL